MTSRNCPKCGQVMPAAAPGGECPGCLLQMSLDMTPSRVQVKPLTVAEIQPFFPDLEILELLGQGGMGAVYKARQPRLERIVAIKVLAPHLAADPAFRERFLREAQAMARLNHPHVVTVHDVGRTAETVYILMEFVEGSSLRERLKHGSLTPTEAFQIIPQLCDAIQYAHDRGVIHRDIKPENVLIDSAGKIKVADFGLAKVLDQESFALTGSGERMGTARYMAPEQWGDAAGVDHRADIYSLGILFYEMLTGDVPTLQFTPPSTKVGTDPRLDQVVSRSLRDEPAERYQQVGDFKSEVVRIATARPSIRPELLVGLLSLVGIGVIVTLLLMRGGPTEPASTKANRPLTPTEMLTSPDWEWSPPVNLGRPINTEDNEGTPFLSADGLSLFYQSKRPGGEGDLDLWESRRASANEPFGEPVNLGAVINSATMDGAPCLSADGCNLVFHSTRGGKYDLWMARRATKDAPWQSPTPVGPIQSEADDFRPWLFPDGLTLTFVSKRDPADGLWIARRMSVDEPFTSCVPLGSNSHLRAVGGPSFSADGATILMNRSNRRFPGNLLWLGRVTSFEEPYEQLTSLGPVVNGPFIDVDPVPSPDGATVYFQSDRPGGVGGTDIWLTRRIQKAQSR